MSLIKEAAAQKVVIQENVLRDSKKKSALGDQADLQKMILQVKNESRKKTVPRDEENQILLMAKYWEDAKAYLRQGDFINKWREFENMKVGNQWPGATSRTKNLPRPVFNIIEMIINHKTSQILNEDLKLIFLPEFAFDLQGQNTAAASVFTAFANMVWQEIGMGDINEQVLDNAATYGCGIWHFYWDKNKRGEGAFKYQGGLAGEALDPVNCYFGNPQCRDIQKQP
ncbi:MAG: hypothetical protein RR396_05520, partial [Clostridiales bacterium]